MKIGIDASNLHDGGGVTHLVELLSVANPEEHGFTSIHIWGPKGTLSRLADHPWLVKHRAAAIEQPWTRRLVWQRFKLKRELLRNGCTVLFAPGGSYLTDFRPVVTMSRNLLPFEWKEVRRYGLNLMVLRFLVLRILQSWSFRNADGVIFLSEYARNTVSKVAGRLQGHTVVIPHGLSNRFRTPPRPTRSIGEADSINPIRGVYVSRVTYYKHQSEVAKAVVELHAEGVPIVVDFIGTNNPRVMSSLRRIVPRVDSGDGPVRYLGSVPFSELHSHYARYDFGIFASSCENLPNTLLENMGAGLPVASSRLGPMPEILGPAGVYFDPEQPSSIKSALRALIEDPDRRQKLAEAAYERALRYTWQSCATSTLRFIQELCT